jgi:endonuclease YncB( thermonuclease family)
MARRRRSRRLPGTIRQPPIYRRHPWASAATVILIALLWVGRSSRVATVPAPVGSDFERYHDRVFTVVNVVDGDTVDIDAPDKGKATTRIRLWGVDTPEVAGSPRGEMFWGPEASAFAKKALLNTRVRLELVEGDTRGKYGRLLAYVHVAPSGAMFNEMLLRGGYAYADTRFVHPFRDRFRSIEADARAGGVGLWRDVTVDQMPRWRRRSGR